MEWSLRLADTCPARASCWASSLPSAGLPLSQLHQLCLKLPLPPNSCLSIVFFLVQENFIKIVSNCGLIEKMQKEKTQKFSSSQCRLAVRYKLARHHVRLVPLPAQRGCKSARPCAGHRVPCICV